MSIRLDQDGFRRHPIHVAPDCWYYECQSGLEIYNKSGMVCLIPWRSIEASVHRKRRAKEPTP